MPKVYRFNNRTPASTPGNLDEVRGIQTSREQPGVPKSRTSQLRHKGEFSPGTSEKPLTRSKSCANTGLVRNIAPTAAARKEHGRSA
jgi:hypothetical protein